MGDLALARCVGDTAAFRSTIWGRTPLHRRSGDDFTDLLDVDDVEQLLGLLGRRPGFRLVADGVTLPDDTYTTSTRFGGRVVDDVADLDRIVDLVAGGTTVVLQGLQRTWPPLVAFCDELQATTSHPVQANAYLSPARSAAFRCHTDDHAVFALQVGGRKRWTVEGLGELTMAPGDVLYLPAGTPHEARSTDTYSLHITIGVITVTWIDVIGRIVAGADGDLARPLPLGFGHPGRAEEVTAGLIAALDDLGGQLAQVDVAAVVRREADRVRGRRRHVTSGRLRATVDPDAIDDTMRVRRRVTAAVAEGGGGGQVVVEFGTRRLRMPAAARPALEAVADADELNVGDLPGLDAPSRAVLARRLVREGLLSPVAPPVVGPPVLPAFRGHR